MSIASDSQGRSLQLRRSSRHLDESFQTTTRRLKMKTGICALLLSFAMAVSATSPFTGTASAAAPVEEEYRATIKYLATYPSGTINVSLKDGRKYTGRMIDGAEETVAVTDFCDGDGNTTTFVTIDKAVAGKENMLAMLHAALLSGRSINIKVLYANGICGVTRLLIAP